MAKKKTDDPKVKAEKTVVKTKAPATVKKVVIAKKVVSAVTPEERRKMIEQAAYFRAEKHGWQVDPQANWVAAEAEVDAILAKR